MQDKKVFIPLGIILVVLLGWIVIQSNKFIPPTTFLPVEEKEEEVVRAQEGAIAESQRVVIGDFNFTWSSDNLRDAVWIWFNNEEGVRATQTPVESFDEVDEPASYDYSSEEDYVIYTPFGRVLILKYKERYLGVIAVAVDFGLTDGKLIYRCQEL